MSSSIPTLHELGWRGSFADAMEGFADSGLVPGRVVLQQRGRFRVATETGEIVAALADEFRRAAVSAAELPCVGDWVAVFPPATEAALGAISAVLPRITKLSRRAAGSENVEQILAANVDTIFIAMGLDGDFNLHRLERYLLVAAERRAPGHRPHQGRPLRGQSRARRPPWRRGGDRSRGRSSGYVFVTLRARACCARSP